MKKHKLIAVMLVFAVLAMSFLGCEKKSDGQTEAKLEETTKEDTKRTVNLSSNSLYVEQVKNLPDDFIMGMDASSVISLENSGVKYYNHDGIEEDVFKILADNGINYIRVRVWNKPSDANGDGYGGGNCDVNTAVEIGKRATKYGMKLLVNFHYSDFWADPSKQMVPKEWKSLKIDEKADALYEYTKDVLNKMKTAGVDVGMVQVGNETNGAMCGEKIWANICELMASGSRAVREVFPEALVAVHFANPEKVTNYKDYSKKLAYYSLDYDVFASSYYPYWHGTLDNLATVLSDIAESYGKKVMVAETSYAYTEEDSDFFGNTIPGSSYVTKNYPYTVQGQANSVRDIIDTVANKTKNGIGVFYWEGTWISVGQNSYEENFSLWEKYGSGWATSYSAAYDPNDAGKYYGGCSCENQAMFDKNGKALESLKVFGLVRTGNVVETKADAIEDITLLIDLNGDIVLPETVNAVMTDNSKKSLNVEWEDIDSDAMHNGGVAKYDIYGEAGGMKAHCVVSMIEYNFLENYSFEDGNTAWVSKAAKKMDELGIEVKASDSLTGVGHYHFWSGTADTVEFTLEQEVKDLPAGTYKYTISIMGGDAGETDIYSYVKINGEIVATKPMIITSYNSWDTEVIDNINYNGRDSITVGIFVKCSGSGNGAWGKIDDALLNSVK